VSERVDDVPCPWCNATISAPVGNGTREKRCWSCLRGIRIIEAGPRGKRRVGIVKVEAKP
jgi:hypothetical protein